MKCGFTGTQIGMSLSQKEQFVLKLYELNLSEFHHGDCIGADSEAHDIVREFFPEIKIIGHPPNISSKRAFKKCDEYKTLLPYLERNHNIVNETDFLIGAPKEDNEVLRSGTWSTIRYSKKLNKLQIILKR